MPRVMLRRIRNERAVTKVLWLVTLAMLGWMGWAWASYLAERAEHAEEQAAQMDEVVQELRALIAEQDRREAVATRRAEKDAEVMQNVVVCLLAQHHDHRENTRHAHDALAAWHGLALNPPAAPPLPDLPSGDVGCEPFRNGDE